MIQDKLVDLVKQACSVLLPDEKYGQDAPCEIQIETPSNPEHGDFACNIAMQLAGELGANPRQIAEDLVNSLPADPLIERVEVAGPGFINFYLSPGWLHDGLAECLEQGETYGHSDVGAGQKVQVEFVSANPVGPIHIGNARGGPFGDTLANLLAAIGCEVQREYYLNDAPTNTQLQIFGGSVQARYRQLLGEDVDFPEEGYHGDYVVELAQELVDKHGEEYRDVPRDTEGALLFFDLVEDNMVEQLHRDCAAMGIEFDVWFSETKLHTEGLVEQQIDQLLDRGAAYEKEDAVWLRTGEHGDEEDRVIVRSDGAPTYIASDIAYAADKFYTRGFDRVIYVWGPDHFGYVPRMKAALAAMGIGIEQAEFIIYQTVRFLEGGEPLSLSKRRGDIVTIRELIEDIGRDAVRFFFLMRSVDAHLDFDLDLARQQSAENPVYYVQYAHTRLCSILREAESADYLDKADANLSLLTHPDELVLLRKLADYPAEVLRAARELAPHRLPHFARELAQIVHQFYTNCRVLDPDNPAMSRARLELVAGSRIVLANILALMGITAPQQM